MFEKVKKLISSELNISADKIAPNSKLGEDLGIDSLDAVELIMSLEEEFEISVPDDKAQSFATVGDIVDFVQSQQKDDKA